MPDPAKIFSRILEALDAKNAPEVARKLGITKQAVYDWQKSTPSLDNLLKVSESTNTSLHWLLTGDGERNIRSVSTVNFEEVLDERIRRVVRDELSTMPVRDLGTIDEFDVASAVKKYDNALPVLRDWYEHDKLPLPEISSLSFHGWDEMTFKQKVDHVRFVRKTIEEDLDFKSRRDVATPRAGSTKKKI